VSHSAGQAHRHSQTLLLVPIPNSGLCIPGAQGPRSPPCWSARNPERPHRARRRRGHLRHACKLGLEGIVSKRKGSPYRSGRSPDWLKRARTRRARRCGAIGAKRVNGPAQETFHGVDTRDYGTPERRPATPRWLSCEDEAPTDPRLPRGRTGRGLAFASGAPRKTKERWSATSGEPPVPDRWGSPKATPRGPTPLSQAARPQVGSS
jgi:hypothetical protein